MHGFHWPLHPLQALGTEDSTSSFEVVSWVVFGGDVLVPGASG